MAKLHKLELYVLDVNDDFNNSQDVLNYIEHQTSRYLNFKSSSQKSVDIKWEDDIDLNFSDCSIESYEAYFIKQEEIAKEQGIRNFITKITSNYKSPSDEEVQEFAQSIVSRLTAEEVENWVKCGLLNIVEEKIK